MGQGRRYLQRHRRLQRTDGAATRPGRAGRRPRGQDQAARSHRLRRRRLGRHGDVDQPADRRPSVADDGSHAHHPCRRPGRPSANDAPRRRRAPAGGRVPALRHHRQHDDQAALGVHLRGDARRARGRHRRQARRPGADLGGDGRLERPHRERQLDGQQPHRAGAQHRRGDHRRRHGRLVEEDHRRRARRDPAAQGSHQHDGRSAALVRRRGDARRARGRHRRAARRPGRGAGRRRHVEGPDRQRQPARRQPDDPGAQHRRGDDGRRPRRPFAQDHRGREGRDSRAEEHHQHHGRSAQRLCRRGDARRARGRHRRQARRPGAGAGRRRHVEGPDRQRQLDGVEPDQPGAQHRRGGDRHRRRRLVEEDHRERQRRNPAAEGDHQHDGRSAQRLCLGSDARRARGRHRRTPRRPGRGARRRRHVEGSDRLASTRWRRT